MAVLYGLHITHMVLIRFIDGIFGSSLFSIMPGFTSVFWGVLQHVVALTCGRAALWALPWTRTESPTMIPLAGPVAAAPPEGSGDWSWKAFGTPGGCQSAFFVTMVLQLVRSFRR
jgi:hypothetical protein